MKISNIEKLKKILDFNEGCHILMLISRKKDNEGLTQSTEKSFKRIVYNEDELDSYIKELYAVSQSYTDTNFRLYITHNPRSKVKALYQLKINLAIYDYEMKIPKIEKDWISCLMKNPATKNYFMFDLDKKDRLIEFISLMIEENLLPTKVVETKNGYHILFRPTYTDILIKKANILDINCELKKDDMLCIGY